MEILLPDGIKVGHTTLDKTGVTVILAQDGAVGGVSVMGCAPGTRETDLLRPENAVEKVNAVCLCGGSAFGLGACDGVVKYLHQQGKGHAVGSVKVPIVAGAVIYDLVDGEYNFPASADGYDACKNATSSAQKWGQVGAGKGATIGKVLGAKNSAKSGVGAYTCSMGNAYVTAITVVNALGDVVDYSNGKILAGLQDASGNLIGTNNMIVSGQMMQLLKGANTTISCIITNVNLTKLQANKLAQVSHDGYAKSISPVHTDYDGDTIFAISKGKEELDFLALSCLSVEAVSKSIQQAVKKW